MRASVISLSGGLDSTSLLVHLLSKDYNVDAVSFRYGQRHEIEIEKASENISYLHSIGLKQVRHKVIDISDAMSLISSDLTNNKSIIPTGYYEEKSMKSTVVPNRNSIFSSILYGFALSIANRTGSDVQISLGVHSGDHTIYPDCRPDFYKSLHKAFTLGNWDSDRIKFYMPYIDTDKSKILVDAKESCSVLGIDFSVLFSNTVTSYSPNSDGISDGRTGSDIERILAFHEIGEIDPVKYTKPWEEVLSYALKVRSDYNKL